MDKQELLTIVIERLERDLAVVTQAALATYEAATHAESKPEDEYDTRGLEASYLAGAQSRRAMEIEQCLNIFRYVDVRLFAPQDAIASTALVELESDGRRAFYLLMPKGGGMSVPLGEKTIHIITPQSPLGEALLGRKVGDQVEVEINRQVRDFDILSVR